MRHFPDTLPATAQSPRPTVAAHAPEAVAATLKKVPSAAAAEPAAAHTHDPADYRKALSCFATGVTVVTTRWQDADWGMTCNSFSSVSLEPRLVLWSIRKAASSMEAFTHADGFTVNVLAQPQHGLARQFATGDMPSRFTGVPLERQASERLRLSESMAWFDCSLHQLVDAGDHHIVIGQVQDFGWRDAAALHFWRSQFGQFAALPSEG